jgi:hypothetical protein
MEVNDRSSQTLARKQDETARQWYNRLLQTDPRRLPNDVQDGLGPLIRQAARAARDESGSGRP